MIILCVKPDVCVRSAHGNDAADRLKTASAPARSSSPRDAAIHASRGIVRGHVVTAVEVLRAKLGEPWTLDSLVAEVHLSRSQLIRSFDATTGLGPMAYLRQMRVERMARATRHDGPVGCRGGALGREEESVSRQPVFPCPLWRLAHGVPASAAAATLRRWDSGYRYWRFEKHLAGWLVYITERRIRPSIRPVPALI